MKKLSIIYILLFSFCILSAQPVPGPAQTERIAIVGATIHQGNGNVIENGAIAFDAGKISFVSKAADLSGDMKKIDVDGQHVYPGIIAVNTTIGLVEIGAVRATVDSREVGGLNPNVRSIIAYNTDSRVTPTVRSNGVLIAQITPQGGMMPGTSSVVQLDAWNWEDAAYKLDDALHLNWPRMYNRPNWWEPAGPTKPNEKYPERLAEIESLIAEAQAYAQKKPEEVNLKLEAMKGLFDKSKRLYINVNRAKEIMDAIELCKKYDVKMVLLDGADSWMMTDLLVENDIPVVIQKTHSLPFRSFEAIDLPYRLPKLFQDAGIEYCLTIGSGWDSFWDQRNLPFHAGTAVTYGLTKEEALTAITSSAAKILGIDDRTGTLEVGKDANIIVSVGDVLDMRTSNITHAFIQGRTVDLDNKQKALYRKFMGKYGLEAKE